MFHIIFPHQYTIEVLSLEIHRSTYGGIYLLQLVIEDQAQDHQAYNAR